MNTLIKLYGGVFMLCIFLGFIFLPVMWFTLYKTSGGLEERVDFVLNVLNDWRYGLLLLSPVLTIFFLVNGVLLDLDLYSYIGVAYISLWVVIAAMLLLNRNSNFIALFVTKHLELGCSDRSMVSIHVGRSRGYYERNDYNEELTNIINILTNRGVERIEFKSYLLHPNFIAHEQFFNMINDAMNELGFTEESNSDSGMKCFNYVVIICKKTVVSISKFFQLGVWNPVFNVPRIERKYIYRYGN